MSKRERSDSERETDRSKPNKLSKSTQPKTHSYNLRSRRPKSVPVVPSRGVSQELKRALIAYSATSSASSLAQQHDDSDSDPPPEAELV